MSVNRDLRRVIVSSMPSRGPLRLAVLGLCGVAVAGGAGLALAQNEQQARCLQLQQELALAQGGGGRRDELPRINQQIAQADRVFQGTRASMEDAGCFESFFIFGKALVRSPRCLNMNARVEQARRQLTQLQQQRQAILGGGGNKRRVAELNDAMARSGCGGVRARRGGLFDFFGGGTPEEMEPRERMPVFRNVDPNGRYRTVCVRLCDGFYFPISYSTYGSRVGDDAQRCQSNCAAPAELYVYRNPGQEIEQAFSLQGGSAYMDLPVALKFRKEYVKGCSCKQAEYNPTQIEAANKQAAADAAAPAPAPAAPAGPVPKLDLDLGGDTPAAPAAPAPAAQAEPPAAPPAAPEAAPPPQGEAPAAAPEAGQSTMMKSKAPPAPVQ
ncbi:MAG: DUF2865 domain-containing protein [Methyloceanibacter sp.]